MKNNILIVAGDPNSINSEIIFKCWKKLSKKYKKRLFLISNYKLIKKQFTKLNYSINLKKLDNPDYYNSNELKIINVDLDFKNPFKVNHKKSMLYVKKCLNLAHNLVLQKKAKGIINCPINKKLFYPKKIGVTEYLASKCKIKKNSEVMLIANNNFAVSPITTHINLKHVSKSINKEKIIKKIKTINSWFIEYKKKKPKIGILGLNPHNAEMRNNSEESKIILPAVKELKRFNIHVKGPLVTDTIFIKNFKNFDVLVGMYHDQVLTPFKTIYGFNAINLTLGLNYPRVSPDHGVAVDLIGKNKANYHSLLKCISFIISL